MTNQSTIDKLIEMHMTSMADAFRNQMQDISMKEIPFDDRKGQILRPTPNTAPLICGACYNTQPEDLLTMA